jgi:hypothetical protein
MSYRIAFFAFQVILIFAAKIPIRFFYDTLVQATYLLAPASLAIAMLCTFWQYQVLSNRSLRTNYVMLAVFVLLGGSPLELQISSEPDLAPVRTLEETRFEKGEPKR